MRRLLKDPSMSDAVVIVNEFGDIGLDQLLVAGSADDVVLLDSGCLCCLATSGLGDTLASLYSRRAAGTLSKFQRVVVETSGLADPAPLLQVFLRDPFVKEYFRLDALITTVDVLFAGERLKQSEEARKQVLFSDKVLLTKVDECERGTVKSVINVIRELNPNVPFLESSFGNVDPGELLDLRPLEAFLPETDIATTHDHEHSHEEKHAEHSSGVSTFTFQLDDSVSWAAYSKWLNSLRGLPSASLLRVKGVLKIEPDEKYYAVQGVHHIFSQPERIDRMQDLTSWGWITFIVYNLSRTDLQKTMDELCR